MGDEGFLQICPRFFYVKPFNGDITSRFYKLICRLNEYSDGMKKIIDFGRKFIDYKMGM
jgi:hypothetical protein